MKNKQNKTTCHMNTGKKKEKEKKIVKNMRIVSLLGKLYIRFLY